MIIINDFNIYTNVAVSIAGKPEKREGNIFNYRLTTFPAICETAQY
ncbi:MAG: hypothetical protein J7539_04650 [Niabella sp.]|nr:hypothetical protein [Niabella sp.]